MSQNWQKEFEADVRKLKNETGQLGLARRTAEWNFGEDPHRVHGNLGVRKSLHRACSRLMRKHLSEWIPSDEALQFCTLSNVDNGGICCYDVQQYEWSTPLNLVQLITNTFKVSAISEEMKPKWNRMITRHLIDDQSCNCKLQIVINDQHINEWYLKRVKQDRVSKSMDIAQNQYRVSYAPRFLVEVGYGNEVIMDLSCPGNFVGLGFWDLVKWRTTEESKNNNNDDGKINDPLLSMPLHSMIHICDDFEIMKKVRIAFGTTANSCSRLQSLKINVINVNEFGTVSLYTMRKPPSSDCDPNLANQSSSSMFMPLIGDLSSPSITKTHSHTNTHTSNTTASASASSTPENASTNMSSKRKHLPDEDDDDDGYVPPLKKQKESKN
eukprot:CAMPEP_0202687818 /NCGR_PEP_ID=MMETSP1385-20130828/3419_1 /ASSEMBLY_ACC=CAM_ASM_000861 /TAXON_ID=933848 /ORGANISM="Elphidium margaritaceum" /LENGTH=382 /DNA_ID=CAMNT_0049342667 /DNA_START=60 /DNA_END=1208 /DNA_ORIENTATION=+